MLKKRDKQWTDKPHHHLKRVAWVNIFAQVAFPVAGTVTPALAGTKTQAVVQAGKPHHLQAQPDRLTAGDEIDVPQSQARQRLAESLRQAGSEADISANDVTSNNAASSGTEHWLASAASRAAGMLKSGNLVENTQNQLRGMAVGEANQTLQHWLQRYGTVKLQANVDDRGRLDGSQFDMLLPLYDTEKQMAFTQFGLRHIDSRTTANVGFGQRHFLDAGMFGYNAFLDHDITRDHTRFGLGAEYARDFMRFGANSYFRASGWKDGKKLPDYEERPANGFDLRAEGYVPSYPQLGGQLIYEQYFGDEVGLLSEARRQKNPAAFTLGVSYTPVPLVTLGLDRRQSAAGGGETLFNFGLNYEIGTPWSKQVDPDAVAFKRSLQGGRYDLVDRNNQIVLEYRKKNLIRLMMESRISGRGGAVIPLNVSVSAKNGLKEIVWDTANLVAGGGKLENASAPAQSANLATESVRSGTHYLLTLPPFLEKGTNIYTLSGVAHDNQGNVSERMATQIQVIASAVNPAGSGFEPTNKSMVADGKTRTVIRLKLTDKDGKPVTGAAGSITLTDDKTKLTGDGNDPALGTEVKEVPAGSGIYEVTATAGTRHGKWQITPTVDGHALAPTVIDFGDSLANMIDTDKTEFKPENGMLNKEGDSTDIILNLKDKDGNPITGATDKIKLTDDKSELYGQNPNPSLGEIREDPAGSGIYKAKVTAGKKKGTWKITPTVDGKALKPTIINFGQSLTEIVDTRGSQFTPATNVLAADNEDSTVLTLHLKDNAGNPIPNARDSMTFEDNGDQLAGDGKNKPTLDKVWEEPESSGIYKVKVKAGDKTGAWKIITKIEGKPLETPTEITFGASKADLVDLDKSEFIPEKGELPNEGDKTVIKLNLKDINGHPITGAGNSIKLIGDNHELYGKGNMPSYGQAKEVPPGSGLYEVPVTAGAKKGKWTLTPEVFGKQMKRPATITFGQSLADILDPSSPTVEPAEGSHALAADGVSTKTLRIALKDKQGKPVTGAKDSIKVNATGTLQGEGKEPQIGEVKEVSDGVYEVVVTAGQKTGNWTLTTTLDGTDRKQETVIEFDENKAPSISNLQLEGVLHVKGVLHAVYQFDAKEGNATDRSFYVWGEKGTTAKRVVALADAAGTKEPIERAQKNGEGRVAAGATDKDKVKYTIESSDIGKVLEVSVLAANEANLRAKAPLTTDVSDPNTNKGITGGNGKGGVADPNAKPAIDKIVLSGELEINKPLTAEYTFNGNGGDATDLSQYAWHEKGTPAATYQPVPDNGKNAQNKTGTLSKQLEQADAGKTLAITVKPVNGNNEAGDPKTVDTGMTDTDINKTTAKGAKPGTVLDPAAKPSIDDLLLEGKLYLNETLTAKYAFNAHNGDTTDKSPYVWKRLRPEDKDGGPREEVPDPEARGTVDGKNILSGAIPSYTLGKDDTGRLLEITITPKNGLGETGTDAVINTGQDHTLIGGTADGAIIDPNRGPIIEGLTINGTLEMGQALTGSYIFKQNDKDDVDNSVYLWGIQYPDSDDPTAPTSPEKRISDLVDDPDHHIRTSGTVPPYNLKPEDSGRIIQLAMVPRSPLKSGNNKMMLGESVATDTVQEAKKSNVTGGNPDGTVKGIADDFTITSETPEKDADGSLAIIVKKTAPDPIKLTINTTVAGGQSVGGVPVTIKMTAMNRQKKSDTVTVKLETEEGVLTGNADSYTGHTDEKGNLVINVTDPDGLGTRTTLSITVNDGAKQLTKTQDVIFTVLTSPDIPLANYWGHMEKTVNDGSNTFYRPLLAKEIDSTLSILTWERNNELWGAAQWNRINNYCQNNLGANLPTIVEAKKLAEVNLSSPEHYLYTHYGWPVNTKKAFFIWTSELDPNTLSISIIGLNNNQASDSGSKNAGGGGRYIIICRK